MGKTTRRKAASLLSLNLGAAPPPVRPDVAEIKRGKPPRDEVAETLAEIRAIVRKAAGAAR